MPTNYKCPISNSISCTKIWIYKLSTNYPDWSKWFRCLVGTLWMCTVCFCHVRYVYWVNLYSIIDWPSRNSLAVTSNIFGTNTQLFLLTQTNQMVKCSFMYEMFVGSVFMLQSPKFQILYFFGARSSLKCLQFQSNYSLNAGIYVTWQKPQYLVKLSNLINFS